MAVRTYMITTGVRAICSRGVNTLVSVQGIGWNGRPPEGPGAAFECQRWGTLTHIPRRAAAKRPTNARAANPRGAGPINYDQSQFVDARKLPVHIEDGVTSEVSPGDYVTVTSVLRIEQQERKGQNSRMFDVLMDGHSADYFDS